MATCKTCGKQDSNLNKKWTNWTCNQCSRDEIAGSCGIFTPKERAIIGNHGSALGVQDISNVIQDD